VLSETEAKFYQKDFTRDRQHRLICRTTRAKPLLKTYRNLQVKLSDLCLA